MTWFERKAAWILLHGWRLFAEMLFEWAKSQPHTLNGFCWPCTVDERIANDNHKFTEGPLSNYCSKCGFDVKDWPSYCANKVMKVNNPKPKQKNKLFHMIGWD